MFQPTDLAEFQRNLNSRIATSTVALENRRLAFQAGGNNWLVDLKYLSEVIAVPKLLPVPLAQRWFLGLANVRGAVYCVSDFNDFAGHGETQVEVDLRVLLLNPNWMRHTGLLVSRVMGLRDLHDLTREERDDFPSIWINGAYAESSGGRWLELDVPQLAQHPSFLSIAREEH
jgi:twitching motility protein PilI